MIFYAVALVLSLLLLKTDLGKIRPGVYASAVGDAALAYYIWHEYSHGRADALGVGLGVVVCILLAGAVIIRLKEPAEA